MTVLLFGMWLSTSAVLQIVETATVPGGGGAEVLEARSAIAQHQQLELDRYQPADTTQGIMGSNLAAALYSCRNLEI